MPKRSRESETPIQQIHPLDPSSTSSTTFNPTTFQPPPNNNPISRGKKPFNPRDGGFSSDIVRLMTAYGDVNPPLSSTATILEEITLDYLTDLLRRARPSPYCLPISSNKVHPNHPLNHILDLPSSSNPSTNTSASGGGGGPDPLNAPTGRNGYAYPPRATIQPDDLRRALRKLNPKPIVIPDRKPTSTSTSTSTATSTSNPDGKGKGKETGPEDQGEDQEETPQQGMQMQSGWESESESEVQEGILNRELERLEEILYLSKMIDGVRDFGTTHADLAKFEKR